VDPFERLPEDACLETREVYREIRELGHDPERGIRIARLQAGRHPGCV
jgi:hypothetical protein